MKINIISINFIVLFFLGCEEPQDFSKQSFEQYWKEKGAEILTYRIENNRYGHRRKGKAVHIFVTELFNPHKQVKADFPQSQEDGLPILKLNRITRFTTGVYDYSLMTSIFSAYDKEKKVFKDTLKTTTSIQDWCGQSFIQVNRGSNNQNYQFTTTFLF